MSTKEIDAQLDAEEEEDNQIQEQQEYKNTTTGLLKYYASAVCLHATCTVLLFIMAAETPPGARWWRNLLAVGSLLSLLLSMYKTIDACRSIKNWETTAPSFEWHNTCFRLATINFIILSVSMWPAVFLYIFHNSGCFADSPEKCETILKQQDALVEIGHSGIPFASADYSEFGCFAYTLDSTSSLKAEAFFGLGGTLKEMQQAIESGDKYRLKDPQCALHWHDFWAEHLREPTLMAGLVLTMFTFVLMLVVYGLSDKHVGEVYAAYDLGERDGVEFKTKDKVLMTATALVNVLITVALLLLAIHGGNIIEWIGLIVQTSIWVILMVYSINLERNERITDDLIMACRSSLQQHLWLNITLMSGAVGVSMLIRVGGFSGFLDAMKSIGGDSALVWVAGVAFGLIWFVYIRILRVHTEAMEQKGELDFERLYRQASCVE